MKKYIIGVDVGGTNVKFGLVNSTGKIVARSRLSTKSFMRNKTKLINAIINAIDELIEENNLATKNILGIGMGLPGLIDPKKGIVSVLPNIPGWRNVPLTSIISKKLKIPTYIDNDVNLITLAEWQLGAGKGCKNMICITLGTGVGGGLILNNQLYRGEGYVAGEIGHVPHHDKELEQFVGNSYLLAKASKIFKNKNITLEEIFAIAGQDNVRAVQFWEEAGSHIGTVLAGLVNVLNPKLIVIGGGVSNNLKFMGGAIRKSIKEKAMKVQSNMVKVVRAKLGDDAGILGASILVKDALSG